MKALVKATSGPGLELVDVPVPPIGRDEVLIRILKTAICGTDVHIYQWDEWAQRTVPVPLVIGHEFVGVIDTAGQRRPRTACRRAGDRRGTHRLRPLPQLSRRSPSSLRQHGQCRRHPSRRVCRVLWFCRPRTSGWPIPPSPLDVLAICDPLGNAAHTALSFDLVGEDVLITGAGPDRLHGGSDRSPRRRSSHRGLGHQPGSPRARQGDGRLARPRRPHAVRQAKRWRSSA